MASIWEELKRRNVVRVGLAYAVGAWLVIEVAATIFPVFGLPDWATRIVVILLSLGFPIVLILAWIFELTPQGVRRENEIDREQTTARTAGRKLDFVIIGLMAIAIGYLVVVNYFVEFEDPGAMSEVADRSVAVLPFIALSSGEDDEYFADGLTEEILNSLAQLPDLEVTGRTSSFFFKGQNLPIPEIAERLGVSHIVEGSVRRDGNRIRATAQLIRASDDVHRWSNNYERTLDDVFAVQQDIAENIATVLGVALDRSARELMQSAGIRDVEAYIDYQKALAIFNDAHNDGIISDGLAIANRHFEEALRVAPNLAAARIYKSDRGGHVLHEIASGQRQEAYAGEQADVIAAMQTEYDEAIRLTPPGNQRDVLILEKTLLGNDWTGVSAMVERAFSPGECAFANWSRNFIDPYGFGYLTIPKTSENLACEPFNVNSWRNLPYAYIWNDQPDEAVAAVHEAISKGITHPWLEDGLVWAHLAAGRPDHPDIAGADPPGTLIQYSRRLLKEAQRGNEAVARRLAKEFAAREGAIRPNRLIVAAITGDLQKANELAAEIDAYPGGPIVFSTTILACFCGAPFDIDVTPNFKARIEEAGFQWPPPKRIDYPMKTW